MAHGIEEHWLSNKDQELKTKAGLVRFTDVWRMYFLFHSSHSVSWLDFLQDNEATTTFGDAMKSEGGEGAVVDRVS